MPFIDCISKIHNTQVVNIKDLDIMIPVYNLKVIIMHKQEVYGSKARMILTL